MKRLIAIALAATLAGSGLVALAQQTQPPAQPAAQRGQLIDGVVAVVNDKVISQSDVRNRMRWMLVRFPEQPSEDIMLEIQNEAIENLIDERIQVQEFYKLTKGDRISKPELDESVNDLAREFRVTREQFNQLLGEIGVPLQHLYDMEEAKIAWGALIRGRYLKNVRVSEGRVDEMLDRIRTSLDKPQYRLAEIFLYAPDQQSRQNAMTRAQTIIQQVNQGADFQALAQQFSAAPSASAGGDLNWLSPGDMRPEIAEAVLTAPEPPVLLPPIPSDGGIYVIALTGKRDPVEAAKAMILDMEQVVARGEGASAKLDTLRANVKSCADLTKAMEGVEGLTRTPMKDLSLMQISPVYRTPLEGKTAGQSTDIVDLPDGGKMTFFVCETRSGSSDLPSRDEIRDRLFNSELALVAERYLRDLKREATIVRR